MEAKIEGGEIIFSVSDKNQTVTTKYAPDSPVAAGGAGLFCYPGELQAGFENFKVTDNAGNTIFADDFASNEKIPEKWGIHFSFWDDGKKPILAKRLGGISWHPEWMPNAAYFSAVKNFTKECESLGFGGRYFADEIYAGAGYPPGPQEGNRMRMSDIQEAKHHTCSMVGHSSLNIQSGPCHVFFTGFPHSQATCRTTVPSQAVVPVQPKPSYYCMRNVATAMDDFYAANFPVEFTNEQNIVHFALESGDKNSLMIPAFLGAPFTGNPESPFVDEIISQKTDILIKGIEAKSASGIDTFNGAEQELEFSVENGDTAIRDITVKDYPTLFKLFL
jgi:hypothetical protein